MARFNAKIGQTVLTGGDSFYRNPRTVSTFNIYSTEQRSFSLSDIDEMVRFPTLAHSMSIVKALYATRDWYITGPKKRISEFLTWNMNRIWHKFINDAMVAMEYGYQPFFIEWDADESKYYIKNMIPLKPHTTVPLLKEDGSFAGFEQSFHTGLKSYVKYIPPEHAFHYAYDMKWNDMLGRSRLAAARFPYVVYKYIIEMANIFYANFADPIKIAKAPSGKAPGNSNRTNLEIMNEKVQSLDVGGSKLITMGSETDEKGKPRWDLTLLESQRDAATYKDYLQFLKVEMTEGLLVPALAGQSGERGSYNLWEGQAASLSYKSDLDMSQFAYMVKKYIFNKLILYNYSANDLDEYDLNFTKASKENRDLIMQMVQAAMQNSRVKPDWDQISRITGIKVTEDTSAVAQQIINNKPKQEPKQEEKEEEEDDDEDEQMTLFPAAKIEMAKRALTKAEGKVEFEKLNEIYNEGDSIYKRLQLMMDNIRNKTINKSKKLIEGGSVAKLSDFGLDGKAGFIKAYIDEVDPIFMNSFNLAKSELGLNKNPSDNVIAATKLKGRNVAESILTEAEKRVQSILLSAINNKTPFETVAQQINDYFSGYETNLKTGVQITVQQFVDDARRDVANDPEVELAQWSAILDERTCPLCAALDGKVVRVDSPEYTEFTPGNIHPYDRCIWVYIKNSEQDKPEPNWSRPPENLIQQHMRI